MPIQFRLGYSVVKKRDHDYLRKISDKYDL